LFPRQADFRHRFENELRLEKGCTANQYQILRVQTIMDLKSVKPHKEHGD
jgi:hypothetical protein